MEEPPEREHVASSGTPQYELDLADRWVPIGKSGAMRCGDLVIAVDPEDPTRFYIDSDRTSDRFVHQGIPLEGYDALDGVQTVLMYLADTFLQHGEREPPVPATGLE